MLTMNRKEYTRNGSDASLSSMHRPSDSPLKLFVQAKKQINDSYANIQRYTEETKSFLQSSQQVLPESKVAEVTELCGSVAGIRDVLTRDIMKVAFFGRTSNGKSTVINAVLKNKILPSGMGHTTNCFLQVEGTDQREAYLTCDDNPNKRQAVESVAHLANALTSDKMGDSNLVRIFWPKSKCSLLRDDVVLMDSPGIDVSANIDDWIDKHCLDADVFILVSNAESTLMRTEKAFFHKVSEKLSKPNVFILNNRWDAIASEPENEALVRKQHTDRNVDFLCQELRGLTTRDEAVNRVFFVSAKEVLQYRLAATGSTDSLPQFAEGFEQRLREFEDFEHKFEECLSQSAIRTKFDQHTIRGKKIVQQVKNILSAVYEQSAELAKEKQSARSDLYTRLLFTQQEIRAIRGEINDHIRALVQQVEIQVQTAMAEEIRRLSVLVSEYSKSFNPDPICLTVYKKDLHAHVEKGLGLNLKARLSDALSGYVENAQKDMHDRICTVIGDSSRKAFPFDYKQRSTFEVFYRLNCESLCSDFQEDLEFRFSLGLISLLRRFSNRNPFRKEPIRRSLAPPAALSPNGDVSILNPVTFSESESMLLLMIERFSMIAPHSHNLGALALGGFMVKTIGWKVIGFTCAVYGLIYFYERMTWNNSAKQKAFKKQYVVHATRKLKLIVDLTSANCSHQVQQ